MKSIIIVAIVSFCIVFWDKIRDFVCAFSPKAKEKIEKIGNNCKNIDFHKKLKVSKEYCKNFDLGKTSKQLREKASKISLFGLSTTKTWCCIIAAVVMLIFIFPTNSTSKFEKTVYKLEYQDCIERQNQKSYDPVQIALEEEFGRLSKRQIRKICRLWAECYSYLIPDKGRMSNNYFMEQVNFVCSIRMQKVLK